MDLDLLDETYPMGKSKLPFKDFLQGGLTGLVGQSNRVCPDLPNLGVNCNLFNLLSLFFLFLDVLVKLFVLL
jgi:hypothetical protein